MSLAGEVRKILQEGPANIEMMAQRLDIPKADKAGRNRLSSTLADLQEAGMVIRTAEVAGQPAGWSFHLTGRNSLSGEVQTRMARVVRLMGRKNRRLTCKDVAALSGGTQEYAARYLRFLKEQEYLLPGTAVKLSRFGLGLAYRVAPGREKEEPPRWNRRAEEARKAGEAAMATPVAGLAPEELQKFASNMRQTFADFCRGLRQTMAAHFPQVEEVLLEMEEDLGRITAGRTPAPLFLKGANDAEPENHHEP
jgi:hypothetical protein